MIGTSRETVTRLFADLKKRQIVQSKGSTLLIRNKAALKSLASARSSKHCQARNRFGPIIHARWFAHSRGFRRALPAVRSASQSDRWCEQGHEKQ